MFPYWIIAKTVHTQIHVFFMHQISLVELSINYCLLIIQSWVRLVLQMIPLPLFLQEIKEQIHFGVSHHYDRCFSACRYSFRNRTF